MGSESKPVAVEPVTHIHGDCERVILEAIESLPDTRSMMVLTRSKSGAVRYSWSRGNAADVALMAILAQKLAFDLVEMQD